MQCRLLENARCLREDGILQLTRKWDLPKFKHGIRFVLFCFVFFFCFYMYVGNLGNHLFKWQM